MRRGRALLVCCGVYLGALSAAVLAGRLLQDGHPLFVAFTADLVATVVVFVFSIWWGMYLFCLASAPGSWWFIIDPAAITGLFLGISIPMMDRHLLDRKSGYAEHLRPVPALIPRLFRK